MMYEKKYKVICIKPHLLALELKIGVICDAMPDDLYPEPDYRHNPNMLRIWLNGKNIGSFHKDLFFNLAEWRDKQINSILNE